MARECYVASINKKEVATIQLDMLDMRDEMETRPTHSKELEPIQLDEDPRHLVYVRSTLLKEIKHLLI